MSKMKELQEFPTIFTFKVIGENNEMFIKNIEKLFDIVDREVVIRRNPSSAGKYISFSVTMVLETYEEMENIYSKIKATEGIKFYI